LAALAILLRILLPVGTMAAPLSASSGLIPIVLCGSGGDVTLMMDAKGNLLEQAANPSNPPNQDHSNKDHCAQACSAPAHTPPPNLACFHDTNSTSAFELGNPYDAPIVAAVANLPPQTGPPHQS
jgi:hypothetical protein